MEAKLFLSIHGLFLFKLLCLPSSWLNFQDSSCTWVHKLGVIDSWVKKITGVDTGRRISVKADDALGSTLKWFKWIIGTWECHKNIFTILYVSIHREVLLPVKYSGTFVLNVYTVYIYKWTELYNTDLALRSQNLKLSTNVSTVCVSESCGN